MAERRRNGGRAQDIYIRVRLFLGAVLNWMTNVYRRPIGRSDDDTSDVSLADKPYRNNSRKRNALANSRTGGPFSGITWNHPWQKDGDRNQNHGCQRRDMMCNSTLQYVPSTRDLKNESVLVRPAVSPQISCPREMVFINLGGQQPDRDICKIKYADVRLSVVDNPSFLPPLAVDGESALTHPLCLKERVFIDLGQQPELDKIIKINYPDLRVSVVENLPEYGIKDCTPIEYIGDSVSSSGWTTLSNSSTEDIEKSSSAEYTPTYISCNNVSVPIFDSSCLQQVVKSGNKVVLGKGGFGEVSLVRYTSPAGVVEYAAIKSFQIDDYQAIAKEAIIMAHLKETCYVPNVIGLAKIGSCLTLVQEYIAHSVTLYEIVQVSFLNKPTLSGWIKLCYQLAEGLTLIHQLKILINDIKDDNILVNVTNKSHPVVKYIDMGSATMNRRCNFGLNINPVKTHMAPEVVKTGLTDFPADIYCLGRMLYKIFLASGLSKISTIAKACLSNNPIDRPDASKLLTTFKSLIEEQTN